MQILTAINIFNKAYTSNTVYFSGHIRDVGDDLPIIERELDSREIIFLSWIPSFVIKYRGLINRDTLEDSFKALSQQDPILKSRVVVKDSKFIFRVEEEFIPIFTVLECSSKNLRDVVNNPPSHTDGVAAITLLLGHDEGYIIFQFSHAIADGGHFFYLLRKLWRIYSDIYCCRFKDQYTDQCIPEQPAKVLERLGLKEFSQAYQFDPRILASMDTKTVYSSSRNVNFNPRETTEIIDTAKRLNMSVHGFLSGVILTAIRRIFGSDPTRIRLASPIDLRRRESDASDANVTTNLALARSMVIPVRSSDSPVAVGKIVSHDIQTAVSKRIYNAPASPEFDVIVNVSNVGKIPEITFPDNARIDEIFMRNPEKSKSLTGGGSGSLVCAIFTHKKRLSLNFMTIGQSSPESYLNSNLFAIVDSISDSLGSLNYLRNLN